MAPTHTTEGLKSRRVVWRVHLGLRPSALSKHSAILAPALQAEASLSLAKLIHPPDKQAGAWVGCDGTRLACQTDSPA